MDHKSHRIPLAPNLPANHPNGVCIPVLREPLFPLPSARGFADEKDFCRACDACSTAGDIVSISRAMNRKAILTCCLDLIYARFEHDATLDYLREDVMCLRQVKTCI